MALSYTSSVDEIADALEQHPANLFGLDAQDSKGMKVVVYEAIIDEHFIYVLKRSPPLDKRNTSEFDYDLRITECRPNPASALFSGSQEKLRMMFDAVQTKIFADPTRDPKKINVLKTYFGE